MSNQRRRRFWWLLGGVCLAILLMAAVMVTLQVRRNSEFESVVRASGGNVIWEQDEVIPSWLHELLPDSIKHAFFDRSAIDFVSWTPGDTKTDADWLALHQRLATFQTRVTAILFEGSRIGDETIATLDEYPNIEVLNLSDTLVSNGSLQSIGEMSQLRILFLDRSKVAETDLSELRNLRRLQYLGVTGVGLTPDARADLESHLPDVTISDD